MSTMTLGASAKATGEGIFDLKAQDKLQDALDAQRMENKINKKVRDAMFDSI